jgi:hypothetical protein
MLDECSPQLRLDSAVEQTRQQSRARPSWDQVQLLEAGGRRGREDAARVIARQGLQVCRLAEGRHT